MKWANHWRDVVKPALARLEGFTSTFSSGVVMSYGKPVGTCIIATDKTGVKTVRMYTGGTT